MIALKKRFVKLAGLALLAMLLCALAVSAAAETLILDNPEYMRKQRPAVPFPHDLHQQVLNCLDCHHDYADGRNMLAEDDLEENDSAIRCASCHAGDTSVDLKSAYHRQCIGCHHHLRVDGQATPPELCGACHRRTAAAGN